MATDVIKSNSNDDKINPDSGSTSHMFKSACYFTGDYTWCPNLFVVVGDGQQIPDPTGLKPLTDQAMRAIANADSYPEFVYAVNLLQDAGYDTSSIFDQPENLVNYLGE